MRYFVSVYHFAVAAGLAVWLTASAAPAWGQPPRPNWKGAATGTTQPEGGVDVDAFGGRSSHLGRFTATGFHVLNPADFTVAGQATWVASNGDTLAITYTGQVFLTGDPVYPFGFTAVLVANDGSGRLSGAQGVAIMGGAFTGVPGEFYFDFEGTLHPNGH